MLLALPEQQNRRCCGCFTGRNWWRQTETEGPQLRHSRVPDGCWQFAVPAASVGGSCSGERCTGLQDTGSYQCCPAILHVPQSLDYIIILGPTTTAGETSGRELQVVMPTPLSLPPATTDELRRQTGPTRAVEFMQKWWVLAIGVALGLHVLS